MNWIVSIKIYGHGAATHVEIANVSNQEIEITKKASRALDELTDYDKSKEGKNFEKHIFNKLKQYINKSRWDNLLEASFGTHSGKIFFDTGY